ncbi:hypothetical protein BJX64DRAFT_294137 [Aspergillus heterothallicus]
MQRVLVTALLYLALGVFAYPSGPGDDLNDIPTYANIDSPFLSIDAEADASLDTGAGVGLDVRELKHPKHFNPLLLVDAEAEAEAYLDIDSGVGAGVELEARERKIFPIDDEIAALLGLDLGVGAGVGLEARKDTEPVNPRPGLTCKDDSHNADQDQIMDGIKYLRGHTEIPKTIPSYNNVADGAQVILNNCKANFNDVQGKLLHPGDYWSVIVRNHPCD